MLRCTKQGAGGKWGTSAIVSTINNLKKTNLTKDIKDLYSENYSTLKKETEENTDKWKHIPCSWMRRNIIKRSILPKAICRFNTLPMKIPMAYFIDLEYFKYLYGTKKDPK